jgi:prevent-host-death family protein
MEAVMQMNVSEAKAKLSELVAAAERGEEVIIARGGQPAVRLVSIHRPTVRIGIGDGLVSRVPDFLTPMSEDELKDWE